MKIAMVSEHASPLAALGEADAGGQNVHVAELALGLARLGHDVRVYTRRDDPALAERVPVAPGVCVVHVPAGPPRVLPKDDLLPHMDAFADWMTADWERTGDPDVVHGHFWMSGLAALRAGRARGVPVYGVDGSWAVIPADERAHGRDERLPVRAFYEDVDHWTDMIRRLAS